jgi:hypothetical protein
VTEALALVKDWHTYLALLLIFGVLPRFTLRLLVRMYPRGHPRRKELVGELGAIDYPKRPLFVAEQLEVCFCEGISARWRDSDWAYRLAGGRWRWVYLPCELCGAPNVGMDRVRLDREHVVRAADPPSEQASNIGIACCCCLDRLYGEQNIAAGDTWPPPSQHEP